MSRKKTLSENDKHELERITKEILSGIRGESSRDTDYLEKKILKYSGHRLGKIILGTCFDYTQSDLPPEVTRELGKRLMNYILRSKRKLDIAGHLVMNDELEKGTRLLRKTRREVLAAVYSFGESLANARGFGSFFEESFYTRFYNSKVNTHPLAHFFSRLYMLKGLIEIKQFEFERARKMWERGLKFTPINFSLNALYAETFRNEGNLDEYRDQTIRLFKIAYRPKQIQRCYHNMGDYYRDQKIYDLAHVCYDLGLRFTTGDYDNDFYAACFSLERESGIPHREISEEELDKICETHGIPRGPDSDILKFAESSGRFFFDREQFHEALSFLHPLLQLIEPTSDQARINEIKALADEAKRRMKEKLAAEIENNKNDAENDAEDEFL